MKQPKKLYDWDFPDVIQVASCRGVEDITPITRDNFQKLIDEHNNLVEVVLVLMDEAEIVVEEN